MKLNIRKTNLGLLHQIRKNLLYLKSESKGTEISYGTELSMWDYGTGSEI